MTLLKSASSVFTTNSSSALPSTIATTSTVSPRACFSEGHSISFASAKTSPKKPPGPIPAPEGDDDEEGPPSLSAARAALSLARSAEERPPPGVSAPAEAARAAA